MPFKSYDFRCQDCGNVGDKILQLATGEPAPEFIECPECKQLTYKRVPSAAIAVASYPDGTSRFRELKEYRKVERELKRARRKGQNVSKHKQEMQRIAKHQKDTRE